MAVAEVSYERIVRHILMDDDFHTSDEAEFAEAMANAAVVIVKWDIAAHAMRWTVRRIGLPWTEFIMDIAATGNVILWVGRALTDASNEICGATVPMQMRGRAVIDISDRFFCPHCEDIDDGGHQYLAINGVGARCPKCGEAFWSFGEYIATAESDPHAFDDD